MGIGSRPRVQDVSVQDPTNSVIYAHLGQELGSTTLASPVTINTSTAVVAAGHGFVIGNLFAIPGYYMGEVLVVNTNTITLDAPFGFSLPAGSTVLRGNEYLNVDGSVTPVCFQLRASENKSFDIYGFTLTFLSASPMDDSLFASLPELANGILCRVKKSDTYYNNVFVARSNQDLKLFGTLNYSTKAPSGYYGMDFTFSFRDQYGVACRLNGQGQQVLEIWVRDNLSTLTESECIVHGHVVNDIETIENTIYNINGDSWQPITSAGASGVILWTRGDDVFINSSESGAPTMSGAISLKDINITYPLAIEADTVNTIYYAKCLTSGESASITVDYI